MVMPSFYFLYIRRKRPPKGYTTSPPPLALPWRLCRNREKAKKEADPSKANKSARGQRGG
jgi:hypothetical protein